MKLHSEFICGNISRPITQTKATDCICPLCFFLMLRTHLQDTRLLLEFTWFYEYCVNLLNLPNRYTLSRPSTPMEGFEEVHEGTWI